VGRKNRHHSNRVHYRRIVDQAKKMIGGASPGKDSNSALITTRIVAGVFQGFPSAFEKYPMLRIKHLAFPGCVAEERSIEHECAVIHSASFNKSRSFEQGRVDSLIEQFLVTKEGNGFLSRAQVLPEFIGVPGSRYTAGHANNGYLSYGL